MIFTSATMLVLNVFVFVAFGIFQGNLAEFEAGFLQILAAQWAIILPLWALLLLPMALPARFAEWQKRYAVLILALAVYTWLQSTFLIWDYGELDGRGLDFQRFHLLGVLDLLLLLVLITGALRYANRVAPQVNTIALLFIIGQLVMLSVTAMGREEVWRKELPEMEIPTGFTTLSSGRNILHIILDGAQTDVFLELIREAELQDEFSGFTVFRDNAAIAPHTAFAVPSTFSGKLYDGSETPDYFFGDAVVNGLHSQLFDAGYSVSLAPMLSMKKGPYSHYYQIPSTYRSDREALLKGNAATLIDISLFRISPHFLRIAIYDQGNWFLGRMNRKQDNVRTFRERRFFRDYIDSLKPGPDSPAYHFLHLWPPHPPYVTLADGSYAGEILDNSRENYRNQMRPMVQLIARLVQRLKSLGLYEDAAIIVHGDHGSSVRPVIDGKTIKPCLPRLPALLAVKKPNSNQSLQVSEARTSLLDIAPTILGFAGGEDKGVFDIDPEADRRRDFFTFKGNQIHRHWIDGSVFDPTSCKSAGSVDIKIDRKPYQIGSTIEFGMQGNASSVTDYGWGQQLNRQVWSVAKESALKIIVPDTHIGKDLLLEMRYMPYVHEEKVPRQRVSVFVNGTLVAEWVDDKRAHLDRSVTIPASLVDQPEMSILFELPDAVSPRSVGLGADRRKLGIAVSTISLSEP